jgi:Protein of unknown function (DUF2911)
MMKRMFVGLAALAMLFAMAGIASAQANPRGKAELALNAKSVTIDYGRPSLKGRTVQDMLGKLPPGGVWRLGADTSTTFSTTGDLTFGSTKVPKGTYSLWARREADKSWKLVFNTQHGQWGTQHDASKDLVAVPLTESKASASAEEVTISLAKADSGGEITIRWGDLELSANFE